MPNNAVMGEPIAPDGTRTTSNNTAAQDGTFRKMVEKPGEWVRTEFKDGLVLTRFADGSYEVIPPGESPFKLDAPSKPQPPAPPPVVIPTEEGERLKYVKERFKNRMPNSNVRVETQADGTTVSINENVDQDGSFKTQAIKSGEWTRVEFKDGLVITKFADGSFEVIPPGAPAFKIDAPAQPQPQQPPPPDQQIAPPPDNPEARKAYLLSKVPDATVSGSERARIVDWLDRLRGQKRNDSLLRKMWNKDEPITSLGLKKGQVSFRQVCKMVDWVPEGASD
jgi:hypothetical protein